MRSKLILLFMFLISFAGVYAFYNTSEGDVKWTSFDNGLSASKTQNKKIVMDVYTDWCGWCKKMDASTYKDPEVARYIKDNFVAIKLNAESPSKVKFMGENYTEQQLAQGFGVTGFPSTIFFDEKQQPITVVPGYLDNKQFLSILKFINDGAYKKQSFEEYMKGK